MLKDAFLFRLPWVAIFFVEHCKSPPRHDRWEAQKEAERAALRLWCISLGTPTGAR